MSKEYPEEWFEPEAFRRGFLDVFVPSSSPWDEVYLSANAFQSNPRRAFMMENVEAPRKD